jgi:hypothetical protein
VRQCDFDTWLVGLLNDSQRQAAGHLRRIEMKRVWKERVMPQFCLEG